MDIKSSAADWYSAAHHKDAGLASISTHCSTILEWNLLCDALVNPC